jgi:carbamoyltransferase
MKNLVVLGVNGWESKGHDASACLLINDKIVSFVEEERFTRKRYAYDVFPINAIKYCLEVNKLSLEDINYLAYGWDMPRLYKLNDLKYHYSDKKLIEMLFPNKLYPQERYDNLPKLIYVKHHLAHAASAYYVSGFKDASILVLDGQGEDSSGMLGVGRRGEIIILKKIPIQYSLGYFMEAACVFLGLRTSDAGKLMGLAGHGKPIFNFSEFKLTKEGYEVGRAKKKLEKGRDQQEMVIKFWLKRFNEKFPQFKPVKMGRFNRLTGLSTEELIMSDFSKNFAASVQKELETVILHLASNLIKKTGEKKLVYAGGVALNCTTNGRIISEGYAEDLYIQPAANDAGVSLGAALHVAYAKGKFNFKPMQTCYYGPEFTDREIEQELKRLKVFYRKERNISRKTAKEISTGKVVAWFQGKMEVGPRALGSRSIVANPMLKEMHSIVNTIKSREQWRPLAPSVTEEDIDKFFEKAHKSPFMLFTHAVNNEYREKIPAVIHADGTTRFQSVSRKVNKNYYNLIDEFGKITGVPIILNTSLNIGGEPIVMTPKQALAAFYNSPIDCLAIGNFWIQKYEKK